jgi:hypothetical protein
MSTRKPSLKELIKNHLISIYPKEMSSWEIEEYSRENGYNGETGRKRVGDLVKKGLVKTRVETIVKSDGKITEVAFHRAVINEEIPLTDMPEFEEYQK